VKDIGRKNKEGGEEKKNDGIGLSLPSLVFFPDECLSKDYIIDFCINRKEKDC
jgi:hypothetical protein